MTFLDTNILLYAISPHPGEAEKCRRARTILGGNGLALSVQVLQEFYVQATRSSRPDPLTHTEAIALVQYWLRHPVVPLTVPVMETAMHLRDRHGISYWDACILSAAARAGCDRVYSEDLAHDRKYGDITVINPFLQPPP